MDYSTRQSAGTQLAEALTRFKDESPLVVALPRGGVVPAAEVARRLHAPLALLLVRKIGHPAYAEYAVGALAENEEPLYSEEAARLDEEWLLEAEKAARRLIARRRKLYFTDETRQPAFTGRTVLLIDDGIATGLTMRAAVAALKHKGARKIIVAVPVASTESLHVLAKEADEVIVLDDPENFRGAVGAHYHEFPQVSDEQVRTLLKEVEHDIQQTAPGSP